MECESFSDAAFLVAPKRPAEMNPWGSSPPQQLSLPKPMFECHHLVFHPWPHWTLHIPHQTSCGGDPDEVSLALIPGRGVIHVRLFPV